jgi:hypothetical protein
MSDCLVDTEKNSLREIAAWLNQNDIPAPRGGAWKPTQVVRVLKALLYSGRLPLSLAVVVTNKDRDDLVLVHFRVRD